ncbi:MAG: hypothetical protein WCD07_00130 [Burkholderiales bacterium]
MDDMPARHETPLRDMLSAPKVLTPSLFAGGKINTDAHNFTALNLAHAQQTYRRTAVGKTPPAFLINWPLWLLLPEASFNLRRKCSLSICFYYILIRR